MNSQDLQLLQDQMKSLSFQALQLFDNGIIVINQQRKIVLWNQWMVDASGITSEQAINNELTYLFQKTIKGRLLQSIDDALQKQQPSLLSSSLNRYILPLYTYVIQGGKQEAVAQSIIVKPFIDYAGLCYCLVNISDVTEVVRREALLIQQGEDLKQLAHEKAISELRIRSIIESTLDGILTFDINGLIKSYNPAAAQLFEFSSHVCTNYYMQNIIFDLSDYADSPIDGVIESLGYMNTHIDKQWPETQGIRLSGDMFPVEMVVTPIETNDELLFTTVIRDISERKRSEERLTKLARFDPLTHLANRSLFYERLEQTLMRTKRNKVVSALVLLDLDRFKTINDTLGHTVGDTLLKQVADRLNKCVREVDLVARLGGDEFAIILEDCGEDTQIIHIVERISQLLASPMMIERYDVQISASMGISLCDPSVKDMESLVKCADIAMYHAKEKGRNNYQFYTPYLHNISEVKLSLESSLHQALQNRELSLVYQPIFDIKTKEIASIEALLRWNHPEHGNVATNLFIPLLEETGLITQIGAWVLKTACQQHKQWMDTGFLNSSCTIAVNFSVRQIKNIETVKMINKILNESELAPHLLDIELTESILMESHRHPNEVLTELKNIGVRISIDDFGTGYSSLSYLKQFPIDNIKIDRSFIDDLSDNSNSGAIVNTIINLAHNLNLTVIAEGVEKQSVLDYLIRNGCHLVQGYLLAKPMDVADIEVFFRNKKLNS